MALAAKAGDPTAAGELVRATQNDVYRFLVRLAGGREAEDLTQETYLRAMRSLPGFAGRSSARTWLLAIARRVAADHVRSTVRRPGTVALADGRTDARTLDAETSRFDETVALIHLLDALGTERREAFVATQVLGLSYAEAAEVCGCPVGTIRSRVARARADLVSAIGADRDGGGRHLRAAG